MFVCLAVECTAKPTSLTGQDNSWLSFPFTVFKGQFLKIKLIKNFFKVVSLFSYQCSLIVFVAFRRATSVCYQMFFDLSTTFFRNFQVYFSWIFYLIFVWFCLFFAVSLSNVLYDNTAFSICQQLFLSFLFPVYFTANFTPV